MRCNMSQLCRTKIQEGDKAISEVLDWYEEVNSQTLAYVTYSIHDSDISDFYRKVGINSYLILCLPRCRVCCLVDILDIS